MRGQGVGKELLAVALSTADSNKQTLKLITLQNHGKKEAVMAAAQHLYQRNGFAITQRQTVPFGTTTVDLVWCERPVSTII